MGFESEARPSDSPYVEMVTQGYTVGTGVTTRPAETNWHMVLVKHQGGVALKVVGPLTASGVVPFGEGVELLWIKFKLGTFMPHMPAVSIRDVETTLPRVSCRSFWLKGSAREFPTLENVDAFVERLVRDEVLVFDPLIGAVLEGRSHGLAPRTVRHRFLQATGMTQNQIYQFERAQQAAALLRQGVPILDVVEDAGYFDQPQLTRSVKRWIGYTPAQIIQMSRPACHFVQDSPLEIADNERVAGQI